VKLTACLYGDPGVGKSPIALTAPGPALLIAAEMDGAEFIRVDDQIEWDPLREPIPEVTESSIVVVYVTSWDAVKQAVEYLKAGQHPFRSVIIDSISELQLLLRQKLISEGRTGRSTEQIWGFLLDDMLDTIRAIKGSMRHPDAQFDVFVVTAHAEEKNGKIQPFVQGGLLPALPRIFSIIGYIYTDDEEGPSASPEQRRLLIAPMKDLVAKDRTTSLPNGGLSAAYGPVSAGPFDLTDMHTQLHRESDSDGEA
jgi:hypothetical protein